MAFVNPKRIGHNLWSRYCNHIGEQAHSPNQIVNKLLKIILYMFCRYAEFSLDFLRRLFAIFYIPSFDPKYA